MKKFKVAVIDDEPTAIHVLMRQLERYKKIEIVGTASSAADGITLVENVRPDVVFLDVELPDMSGIKVIKSIKIACKTQCKVVMYTAYDKYMLESFRNYAFDFLLKPLDTSELDIVMERLEMKPTLVEPFLDQDLLKRENQSQCVIHGNSVDLTVLQIKDICFFQYNHKQRIWEAFVANQPEPVGLKRNTNASTILDIDNRFIQVSHKHIINIDYLLEVVDNACRFFPPFEDVTTIKVGRMYRKNLRETFKNL